MYKRQNRYRQNAGFEDVNLSVQKERKKVTLKRDKSILKEVTDYAVGQLEGNEWKYEEKYHCSCLLYTSSAHLQKHTVSSQGGTTAIGGNHMTNQSTIDKEVKKKSRKKP